jgi:hypothetical protein
LWAAYPFLPTRLRAHRRPAFPAPSAFKALKNLQNPGGIVPRERAAAPIPAAFFANVKLAATTSNSLYGCTDPFKLLATRKGQGLGQSSNRSNNDDKEAT